jgi:hypothetical protein
MQTLRVFSLGMSLLVYACGGRDAAAKTDGGQAGSDPDASTSADAGTDAGRASVDGGAGSGGAGGATPSAGSGGQVGGGSAGASGSGTAGGQGSSCLPAGAYCTWSNASDCCSGSCDGDSCCGFLGDACNNGFGCCAGNCIEGYCQCGPGTLDCGNGCVDIEWNENRCGGCDAQCGENSLCENAQCICDPNLFDAQFYLLCPDGCFNTHDDEQHCGDCTTVCTGGTECSGGTCQCPFGTQDCGNGCEDITSSPLHCGACGSPCDSASEQCVNQQCQCKPGLFECTPGTCVDRQTDDDNCGTCGVGCTGNKTCQGGVCAN